MVPNDSSDHSTVHVIYSLSRAHTLVKTQSIKSRLRMPSYMGR